MVTRVIVEGATSNGVSVSPPYAIGQSVLERQPTMVHSAFKGSDNPNLMSIPKTNEIVRDEFEEEFWEQLAVRLTLF